MGIYLSRDRVDPAPTPVFQTETMVIASAWLMALCFALILAALKGVPSALRVLLDEIADNADRDWYWVGAVLPANLVALAAARDLRDRLRIVTAVAAFGLGCVVLFAPSHDVMAAIYVGAKSCAIFGVLVLALQVRLQGGWERLLVVVMFTTYLAIRLSYLPMTYVVRADTFDLYTIAFDNSLGFNVAAWLSELYDGSRVVSSALKAVYVFVLLLPLSLYAAQRYCEDPQSAPMLRVFIMATTLGFLCYLIFPVSGPRYFLGSGDISQELLAGAPRIVEFHASLRNGMPSVHFAIALLMMLNVPRPLRAIKLAFFAYCGLTALATMANGEHYLCDLVAALPFVCAVQGFCLWLNAPRTHRYLLAGVRSLMVFAAFLIFLIVAPGGIRTTPYSWIVVALVLVHFATERRGWRQEAPDLVEHAVPIATCLH